MSRYIVAADFTVHPLINKTKEEILKEILEDGLGRLNFRNSITLINEEIAVEEDMTCQK
jgi:hypothetical protein